MTRSIFSVHMGSLISAGIDIKGLFVFKEVFSRSHWYNSLIRIIIQISVKKAYNLIKAMRSNAAKDIMVGVSE